MSVCSTCKRRGIPCVSVARGIPCLGPVVRAGCGALCPAYGRGCYGCFGPLRGANVAALPAAWRALGADDARIVRALRGYTASAEAFRKESERHEPSHGT